MGDRSNEYKRVLLKISGEILMGSRGSGHDLDSVRSLCGDVRDVHALGIQVCLVVGGGNIFRGASVSAYMGLERASNDYAGMLATVINALVVQSCLDSMGVQCRVLSAITMTAVCEPYIRRRAIRHLEKGRVVIFAAGTGNPFFSTDTAAALRAVEMGCDAIFKGTQVSGVYSADPRNDVNATRFDKISYTDLLAADLKVMDAAAVALARESSVPIVVFSLHNAGAFANVIKGLGEYTLIS